MPHVRVNLTIDQEIWKAFADLVPAKKRSSTINELLKEKVKETEEDMLSAAFKEAAGNKGRIKEISDWSSLDIENFGD